LEKELVIRDNVLVVMATYNGSAFLKEQLESITSQSFVNIALSVVDDCSSSEELKYLRQELASLDVKVYLTENRQKLGASGSFFRALTQVEDAYDFYAFADQDDVWMADKLITAINSLKKYKQSKALLFCSRTKIVDENLTPTGCSPIMEYPASFSNSIAQSLAGGNTMVFNGQARSVIALSVKPGLKFVAHDWWCYILICGNGGVVIYDPVPKIYYRQHGNNILGANSGFTAKLKRFSMLMAGDFRKWNDQNLHNINENSHLFLTDNIMLAEKFDLARKSNVFQRIKAFFSLGIRRQSSLGNCAMFIAWVMRKM
jgi:glycosyltransferase involved in cell wall biosynthesis